MADTNVMDKLVSLCKRRGFVFQSSEIYGGLGSVWDYGPLGVELKKNVKDQWWRAMVHARDDIEGLDAAILMHPRVWEASGHVSGFTDPLVDCRHCKNRFRADDPRIKGTPGQPDAQCPVCGSKGTLTEPRMFNLMFKTFMGPVEESAAKNRAPKLNAATAPGKAPEGMAWVPGGWFWMGDGEFPDAQPEHLVYIDGFWMDTCEVTNAEFARFVAATGYQTIAERPSRPRSMLVPVAKKPWVVRCADWQNNRSLSIVFQIIDL